MLKKCEVCQALRQGTSIIKLFLFLCLGLACFKSQSALAFIVYPCCSIKTNPQSPIYLPVNQPASIPISSDCETTAQVSSGTLPPGMEELNKFSLFSAIVGTPNTAGAYLIQLTASDEICIAHPDKNECTDCTENSQIRIIITSPETPNPPQNASVVAISSTIPRAKECSSSSSSSSTDIIDVIRWKAPRKGPSVEAFIIFRDKALTKPLAIIPNEGQKHFRFKHAVVKQTKKARYYIVSVGLDGSFSHAAVAKLKK